MANSVDPDKTAPIGAVCSGPTLFASILNSSVILDNYLQQTTSADDLFKCIFLGALRVNAVNLDISSFSSDFVGGDNMPQVSSPPVSPSAYLYSSPVSCDPKLRSEIMLF